MLKECKTHGLVDHVDVSTKNYKGGHRCRKCRSDAVQRRRRKIKQILVNEAGGKCVLCSYSKSLWALEFHHIDPSTKSFGLGMSNVSKALSTMREETAKCVLLCSNCHREVEHGVTELALTN